MKVRDLIKQVESDGWRLVATRGSHRQYKHPVKLGPDLGRTEALAMRKYAVVVEKGPHNYSAYVPDLPGCISTGNTLDEIKANIREAVELHLEGMIDDGLPIPEPTSVATEIEMPAASSLA